MTNAKSASIWLFPILLWALACGPTAPATGGGNAAVEPTPQTQRIAPGVQMQNASSGEHAPSDAGLVSATTSVPTPPDANGSIEPNADCIRRTNANSNNRTNAEPDRYSKQHPCRVV